MFKKAGTLFNPLNFFSLARFSNASLLKDKAFVIIGATDKHRRMKATQLINQNPYFVIQHSSDANEVAVYISKAPILNRPYTLTFEQIKELAGNNLLNLAPEWEKEMAAKMEWEEKERTAPHYTKMVNELLPNILENPDMHLFSLNHCTHYLIFPKTTTCKELHNYLTILNDFGIKMDLDEKSKLTLWTHPTLAFISREPIETFYHKLTQFRNAPEYKH